MNRIVAAGRYESLPVTGERQNLKDMIATVIRSAIFSGELRPGEKINQDELAEHLRVSKIPIREALVTLEAEGLIENVPRRGAFVSALSPDDVIDHFSVVGLVSGALAARATARIEPAQIDHMREVVEAMRGERDPGRFDGLNEDFHRTLNRAARARRLSSVLVLLIKSMPSDFYHHAPAWLDAALDQHIGILRAIEARDPEAVAERVKEHFRDAGTEAVTVLANSGFWADELPAH